MKWPEAVRKFGIQQMYADASIKHECLLKDKIVEYGLEWLANKNRPSLYLWGVPGCGKTYFMTALCRHLIESGRRDILYTKSKNLDQELLESSLGNLTNSQGYKIYEKDLMARYSEIPILFIDDLGDEKDTDRIRQKYGSIIDDRVANRLVTVYTSNLDLDMIANSLGTRIASRLQISIQIKFPDVDFRKLTGLRDVKNDRLVPLYGLS